MGFNSGFKGLKHANAYQRLCQIPTVILRLVPSHVATLKPYIAGV